MVMAIAKPMIPPNNDKNGDSVVLVAAKRKRTVSIPSLTTAKKANPIKPSADPLPSAECIWDCSWSFILTACFLIQNIIQVRMAAANNIADPSDISSTRPSNLPAEKYTAVLAIRLVATASLVPTQTGLNP